MILSSSPVNIPYPQYVGKFDFESWQILPIPSGKVAVFWLYSSTKHASHNCIGGGLGGGGFGGGEGLGGGGGCGGGDGGGGLGGLGVVLHTVPPTIDLKYVSSRGGRGLHMLSERPIHFFPCNVRC